MIIQTAADMESACSHIHRLMRKTAAVVTDFDGVIAHTEPYGFKAFTKWAMDKVPGLTLDPRALANELMGIPEPKLIATLQERHGIEGSTSRFVEERAALYLELAKNSDLAPNPYVVDLLRAAQDQKSDVLMLSNAKSANIETLTRHWDIDGLFKGGVHAVDSRAIVDKVEFLQRYASSRNLEPDQILFLEDSESTAKRAKMAGFNTIFVVHDMNDDKKQPPADLVIRMSDWDQHYQPGMLLTPTAPSSRQTVVARHAAAG
jgi:beta-phosphoglucomutase-like phosphatase (HAD superfamily)